ncbi:ABC transporter ATP-binding protein [Alicyclobacillus sendaiensis]|uniref:ABC transporter transmembrane domain-containing protein n=1 Tax=Alicyclobacillus sendaiensis PA2 TaxID=3029425 RepID=A0ABT6XUA1_ALISE|nr:ABC transporter transmembrane domain-containing protein [Alicyclobacillus sendaiensis]MDI9258674.1 ABC transporter transmembrane domain-containing protein [Alicyclobacillus sendaiensis PA2]
MFQVLWKLRHFFWQERRRYGLAVGLLLFLNLVEILPPYFVGRAVDLISEHGLTASSLAELVGFLLLTIVVSYVCGFTWQYQLYSGARTLELSLRRRLMQHFLRMTPRFFEQYRTGDLMARSTNDLNAVMQTAGFGILTLIDSTTWSLTILVTMAVADSWKLTLASLLPMPVIAILMTKFGQILHGRFERAQDAFGDMNDRVLETVAGIRVVRAYAQEENEERRFAETMEDVYRKNAAVAQIDALFDPTISMLVGVTYLIGLGYGTYLVFQGQLTVGQLTSFNVYLGMLIWPMLAVGQLINIMQRGNASLDRVNEVLAYPPDVVDQDAALVAHRIEDIRFERYSFRYPASDRDNLVDIDLVVKRGETLGVVGRTGSGKSTLVRQLLREYPVGHAGRLLINGQPIERFQLDALHRLMGYVPQNPMLFSRSVRDNVRFAKPDASDEEVLEALELAGFTEDLPRLPNGLDTMVGERGISLSGGQKQRIALARALILDPDVLILDDAMSAVDARTEVHILRSIRRVRQGRTTIIVSHRMPAVQHADRIVVLDDGRIAEEGTFQELMRLNGWYAQQYLHQQAFGEAEADLLAEGVAEEAVEERGALR